MQAVRASGMRGNARRRTDGGTAAVPCMVAIRTARAGMPSERWQDMQQHFGGTSATHKLQAPEGSQVHAEVQRARLVSARRELRLAMFLDRRRDGGSLESRDYEVHSPIFARRPLGVYEAFVSSPKHPCASTGRPAQLGSDAEK